MRSKVSLRVSPAALKAQGKRVLSEKIAAGELFRQAEAAHPGTPSRFLFPFAKADAHAAVLRHTDVRIGHAVAVAHRAGIDQVHAAFQIHLCVVRMAIKSHLSLAFHGGVAQAVQPILDVPLMAMAGVKAHAVDQKGYGDSSRLPQSLLPRTAWHSAPASIKSGCTAAKSQSPSPRKAAA